MDDGRIDICGEESFGTGSDHIREKDGIWAVLAWLSVVAASGKPVQGILENHWNTYGRNFFTRYVLIPYKNLIKNLIRYDYEDCESEPCQKLISDLESLVTSTNFVGTTYQQSGKTYVVAQGDNYRYTDPVDGSIAEKQGIRIIFKDGSRLIFRLSGTGSSGATLRVYVESYESDKSLYSSDPQKVLAPLVKIALDVSKLEALTGRKAPTVIT